MGRGVVATRKTDHSVTSRNSELDNSQVGLLARGSQRQQKAFFAAANLPRLIQPSGFLEAAPHSQWRDRAGFTPDFPVMPNGHLQV